MKTAEELLDELLPYVQPPRGCAIVLTEETATQTGCLAWASCRPPRFLDTKQRSASCASPILASIGQT